MAAALGIPAAAIAAPIEREITASDAAGMNIAYSLGEIGQKIWGSVAAINIASNWYGDFSTLISGANGPIPIWGKGLFPDLLDVGSGKIQIYNAYQNVLQNYFTSNGANDPAGLAIPTFTPKHSSCF